jgi:hypothetical protein
MRKQLDPGSIFCGHVRIDLAKPLVSQGHAEWDVDVRIVLRSSDGSNVSVLDAIVGCTDLLDESDQGDAGERGRISLTG